MANAATATQQPVAHAAAAADADAAATAADAADADATAVAAADDDANAAVDAAAAAAAAAVAAHTIARALAIVAPVVVPLDEHARVDEYLAAVAPADAVVERHVLAPVCPKQGPYGRQQSPHLDEGR